MKRLLELTLSINLLLLSLPSEAQISYDMRFKLASLDTIQRSACFNIELRNSGVETWILSNYNVAIFYDTSAACFSSFNLVLEDAIYDPSITNIETSASGTPLPYEMTLGFIRAGLAANAPGVVMDTSGTWVPTIQICFDVKLENITSPNTSFHVNFNSDELQPFIGVPPNIVQEWNPNVFISDVAVGTVYDNNPAPTLSSSFVIEENSLSLCTDGIDNDEDGLTDCDDGDGCSVGDLSINVTNPSCLDSLGRIRINGMGPNVTYSIDDGMSFTSDSIFNDLPAGDYNIISVRNDILVCMFESPVPLSEPDCVENNDILCGDGLDNDLDGLIDCDDPDCLPLIDNVVVEPAGLCPDLNDGTIEIESLALNQEFSIDSGMTYSPQTLFQNLEIGKYNLFVRNTITLCESDYSDNPIVVGAQVVCPDPDEDCSNGIDDDLDGLIDCLDAECFGFSICNFEPEFYVPTAFLPRGQLNNTFGLFTPLSQPLLIEEFSVFNRWGEAIFTRRNTISSDPGHKWDGRLNGEFVRSGVYVYFFSVSENGKTTTISGDITVIY